MSIQKLFKIKEWKVFFLSILVISLFIYANFFWQHRSFKSTLSAAYTGYGFPELYKFEICNPNCENNYDFEALQKNLIIWALIFIGTAFFIETSSMYSKYKVR